MGSDPIIAQTGVEFQALSLGANALEDGEALVEKHWCLKIRRLLPDAVQAGWAMIGGDVEIGRLPCAQWARRISAFHEFTRHGKDGAPVALITERPDHNRWMISVALQQLGRQAEREWRKSQIL